MKKSFRLVILIICFFFGCQTYTSETQKIRTQLYSENFKNATKILDESSFSKDKKNLALFCMEKGMLLYLQSKYQEAVKHWLRSDQQLDILYTTSVSKTTGSFLLNDTITDYTGEDHERILLPIFSSLAFFAKNDPKNALVMIRRTYDIKKYLSQKSNSENIFKYDGFSSYFSGMVYEAEKEWDNAIVEYKNALKNIQNNPNFQRSQALISKDLARLAEFRNRNDILLEIKKNNPNINWQKQSTLLENGEVYIVYESGKSPIKVSKEYLIPTDKTVVKISFPDYQNVFYENHFVDVFLNNKHLGRSFIMEDIGQMAKVALTNRRARDMTKIAARVLAKDLVTRKIQNENPLGGLAANIFSVMTEVADTRSWTSLPDSLQIFRVIVPPQQEAHILLKIQKGPPFHFQVKLKAGEKKLYRLRTLN
jgi:hypothetical protein